MMELIPSRTLAGALICMILLVGCAQASGENGTLVVYKQMAGIDGISPSEFMISVSSDNGFSTSFPGDSNGTNLSLAPGNYTVGEILSESFMQAFSGGCQADGSIEVAPGASLNCTVTNTFIDRRARGSLAVFVYADSTGPLQPSDFQVNVTGSEFRQFTGNDSGTWLNLLLGYYNVNETPVLGYETTYSGDCADISLSKYDNLECDINNTFIRIPAPDLAIISPANLSYGPSSLPLALNFTAVGDSIDSCSYSINSGVQQPLLGCSNITLSLQDGNYSLTLFVNNTIGNSSQASASFLIDTAAPALAIYSPSNNSTVSNATAANFTLDDADPDSCWYVLDGGSATGIAGCQNFTLPQLLDGPHTLVIYANDTAGNINYASSSFTVDSLAPNVSITSFPAVGNSNKNGVAISGSCESGIMVFLTVSDPSVSKVSSSANCSNGSFSSSLDLSSLSDGALDAAARQTDAAGNIGIANASSSKDTYVAPPTQAPSSSSGGGSGGGGGGAASGSQSSAIDVSVGNGSCGVEIKREIESSNSESTITTTVTNTGDSPSCDLSDFIFTDTIPPGFASMDEVIISPQSSSADGGVVSFAFPSFSPGESRVITYTVQRWAPTSTLGSFSQPELSAAQAAQPGAEQPQAPATAPTVTPPLSNSVPNVTISPRFIAQAPPSQPPQAAASLFGISVSQLFAPFAITAAVFAVGLLIWTLFRFRARKKR